MSRDLAAFVAARLDEDEAAAKAATSGPWSYEVFRRPDGNREWVLTGTSNPHGVLTGQVPEGSAPARRRDATGIGWMAVTGVPDPDHIACHDPVRVLRQVAAGRAILARYQDCLARQEDDGYPQGVARDQAREYEDFVLPGMAAAWGDHPDYLEDWRP